MGDEEQDYQKINNVDHFGELFFLNWGLESFNDELIEILLVYTKFEQLKIS